MQLTDDSELPDLLVSGPNRGGLALVHQGKTIVLDRFGSTGLWVAGDLVFRAVMRPIGASIWIYHRLVPWRHYENPQFSDIHDARLIDGQLTLVSTGTNEIVQISTETNQITRLKAPGEGDSWHLNSVCAFEDKLVASGFGVFPGERGWNGKTQKAGFIMDVRNAQFLYRGLSQPHSLTVVDGELYVCNSQERRLVHYRGNGTQESWPIDRYTRGLAADERWLFVGENQNRHPVRSLAGTPEAPARVVMLERPTMRLKRAFSIPFREIYDIRIIPSSWFDDLISGEREAPTITPLNRDEDIISFD